MRHLSDGDLSAFLTESKNAVFDLNATKMVTAGLPTCGMMLPMRPPDSDESSSSPEGTRQEVRQRGRVAFKTMALSGSLLGGTSGTEYSSNPLGTLMNRTRT